MPSTGLPARRRPYMARRHYFRDPVARPHVIRIRTRSSASRSRDRRPAALPTTDRFLFTSIFTARDAFTDGRVPPRRRPPSPSPMPTANGTIAAGGRADKCFFRPTPNSEFLQRPTVSAAIVTNVFHFTRANVLPPCRSIGNDDFVNVFVLRLCPSLPTSTTFRGPRPSSTRT